MNKLSFLILLVSFPIFSLAGSESISLKYFGPPSGQASEPNSPMLRATSKNGLSLDYLRLLESNVFFGGGVSHYSIDYERLMSRYTSKSNYFNILLGYSYTINESSSIDLSAKYGIGKMNFSREGGNTKSLDIERAVSIDILYVRDLNIFENIKGLAFEIGIGGSKFDVDSFTYENASINSAEFDKTRYLSIGLRYSF